MRRLAEYVHAFRGKVEELGGSLEQVPDHHYAFRVVLPSSEVVALKRFMAGKAREWNYVHRQFAGKTVLESPAMGEHSHAIMLHGEDLKRLFKISEEPPAGSVHFVLEFSPIFRELKPRQKPR